MAMNLRSKGPGWPKGMKGDLNRGSRMAGFFGKIREPALRNLPHQYGRRFSQAITHSQQRAADIALKQTA